MIRAAYLGLCLALLLASRAWGTDAAVIINEIHYHPVTGDTEWIELHSLSGVDVDLSGWKLANGVDYTFADGVKIPGHAYLIVAANPAATSLNGLGALGPWTGALANSGEKVTLQNRSGREMDSVTYSDGGDWPAGADGSGATLARRNSESADQNASGWAASADAGGTPGRANFATSAQAATVTNAVTLDSNWKYFVGTPPAGWEQPAFSDASWSTGQSLLYFGSPTIGGGTDGLLGYWPLNETSGATTANLAPGGTAATLFNSPTWMLDGTRGQVLQFNGTNQYVNAGNAIIPRMTLTNDFTWSFWASSLQSPGSNVILGNRHKAGGGDWTPLEFIKFTPSAFEFYRNDAQEGIDYADIAQSSGWIHHVVVKSGAVMTYYRNGAAAGSRTITAGNNNAQPLFFGGDATGEWWAGKLDDIAVWTKALTTTQVASLANGTARPDNVSSAGTLRTLLGSATTYAFRNSFTFTGSPSRTTLTLKLLMEDGCTVWLNGQQVYAQNDPPSSGTTTTNISADISIPNTALIRGTNVLAVRVKTFASDPDMVFGASLTLSELPPTPADQVAGLVFNEISAGGAGFQVELANQGASAINLAGYSIRSSAGVSYTLSGTLNAGSLLVLNATQLGFTPVSGDKLFLFKADGIGLLDSRQVTNKLRGLSTPYPGRWLYPAAASFGSANTFTLTNSVVLNEIMYRPRQLSQSPYVEDPEQWVELYNRSVSPISLAGWQFTDGITYTFPAGTTIPAGGYLVVSNNATALQTKWPAVASKILGNFSGTMAGGGELLRLCDANGNPANEVNFGTEAPWPGGTKSGGSSLELRDPRADNSRPQAWAASNEAYRGSWQTFSYETTAAPGNGNDPATWNEFDFGLLDEGSVMIDDVSVIESPTGANRQLIQNGAFANTAKWRFLGTHSRANAITDPFGTGNVLRLDATGPAETMHNHAETMLAFGGTEVTLNSSLTYRVSFRARWVSGSNLLNSRLYFGRIQKTSVLPVAVGGGTPGAQNTSYTANIGPTFSGLAHSPAIPAATQAATVTVTASDPDGLGAVSLFYAVNGGSFASVAMTSLGAGKYSATIPGQAAGTKVQFYAQAADGLGVLAFAPAGGASSRALIQWDDGLARLTQNGVSPNNIRIVMTDADTTTLHAVTNVMSNDRMPCTVVWNERDVYYDCGVHLHGSERGRDQVSRVSFNVRFPGDQPLLGTVDSMVIDRSGSGNQTSQKEILIKRAILRSGGLPGSEDDLVRVIAPLAANTGPAIFGRQRIVTGEYLGSAYASGGDGDLFKYELIYAPTTTDGSTRGNPENLKYPEPDGVAGVNVVSLGTDKESYRWHWLISNLEAADDYSRLLTFLAAYGRTNDAQYYTDTTSMMDVSEWLRGFAMETLFGIGDNYATGSQHNFYLYRQPSNGKWIFFPYDMDFTFNSGTTSSMFQNGDLSKLVGNAGNLRTYWKHVYEICQTSFSSTYLAPWAQHYNNFVAEDLTQFMSYVDARRTYALGQLSTAIPTVTFAITTPAQSAPGPTFTISGNAWVDVAEMRLAGSSVPLTVNWTTTTAWQASVTIAPGPNTITINAFNYAGTQIGTATVVITGTGPAVPATAANLVISEIMYHPGPASTAELNAGFSDPEAFEFIELQNISATNSVTLANCQFTAGVALALPTVTLAPGARAMVVGNQAAFTQRYGSGFTILGAYQPRNFLANSGDHIVLLDAQGQVIRDFSYNDKAPWPQSPDGDGFSLVLINPASNPDHANPLNWRASVAVNGNPGTTDATTLLTDPVADDDHNGITNLVQYALSGTKLPTGSSDGSFLYITFRRNLAADDVTFIVERSTNLTNPASWSGAATDVTLDSETHNADGTATYVWRSLHPFGQANPEFLRLRVVK